MPILDLEGMPTYGTDAAGANAYVEIVAAPPGNRRYRNIRIWCATNDAIVSLDAGTTGHIYVVAGTPVQLEGLGPISAAIHAKNATGGSNYANLFVQVW